MAVPSAATHDLMTWERTMTATTPKQREQYAHEIVTEPPNLEQHVMGTYFDVRLGIAVMGFSLPILLALIGKLLGIPLQGSMSAYYHALAGAIPHCPASVAIGSGALRNLFVGILTATAVSLYVYKGFSQSENVALNLAGIALATVAFVPMAWPECDGGGWISAHGGAAVFFFLCIAYVSVFRAMDTISLIKSKERAGRYKITYRWLGIAMIVSPLAAVLWNALFTPAGTHSSKTFFLEAFGVFAFAGYWLVKSFELKETSAEAKVLKGKVARVKRREGGRPDDAELVHLDTPGPSPL